MGNQKIKGKDLDKINFQSDRAKSLAIEIIHKHYKRLSKSEKIELLKEVHDQPEQFSKHSVFSILAEEFIGKVNKKQMVCYELDSNEKTIKTYGKKGITADTIQQMEVAMKLPISKYGALMPDAHLGYGLPIGGVLATKNAVLPYGVGMDIACRMCLSLYKVPDNFIKRYGYQIKVALKEQTHFGMSKMTPPYPKHAVLDHPDFQSTQLLKHLQGKARIQLGSSGSGNHFAEFGEVELFPDNEMNLPAGNYLGILTHSGSRGVGAEIARHYTKIAIENCKLPKGAQHLAWLDLNSQEGQEYWIAMNLAGDFAKACHEVIHNRLAKAMGLKAIATIENHHNFAWKEFHHGEELIVHRKGATPAHSGQMGIIPANMMDTAFLVSGTGNPHSLCSASHGAGRRMSRKKARESITGSELKKRLQQKEITLLGGCVDEAPMSYKNLNEVMKFQSDLVKVEGSFQPRIVRMDKA